MANFIARIELQDASYHDYALLDAYMALEGFRNTLTAHRGIAYRMPPADYLLEGDLTCGQVLEKAERASRQIGRSHAAFVCEYSGYAWTGLREVQAHRGR